jgi:hypothetical protein
MPFAHDASGRERRGGMSFPRVRCRGELPTLRAVGGSQTAVRSETAKEWDGASRGSSGIVRETTVASAN